MARKFYIDTDENRFVLSPTNSGSPSAADFFNGDDETLNVYFLAQTGIAGRPYRYLNKSSASVKVGLGETRPDLTGGTWTITYGANTTSALAYNATASQVETALNALASVTSAGGVTVTKAANAARFTVTFTSDGSRTAFSVDDSELIPDVSASVSERIAGTSTVREVQVISLNVDPVAFQSSFSDLPTSITPTVSTVTGGSTTASEVQKIAWDTEPAGGSFSITLPSDTRTQSGAVVAGVFTTTANHGFAVGQPVSFSGFTNEANFTEGTTYYVAAVPSPTTFTIAATSGGSALTTATADSGSGTITTPARTTDEINATATFAEIETALEALDTIGSDNVSVTGIAGEYILISFTGSKRLANLPAVTVTSSNLTPAYGKTGDFNLSTFGLQDLLDATDEESVSLRLEVQLTESGVVTTTGADCVVTEDIIKAASLAPAPIPGLTRYGTASILSGSESVSVTFSTAFAAAPSVVIVSVEWPTTQTLVFASVLAGSITATGFDVELSDATSSSGYKLHYYAIA